MKLGRNVAAGLGSSVFVGVVGLAVVPFYLKYLGVEAYGLIGFFATTQALFQLLDMGLAQTVNREISRYSVEANFRQAANLLHTLAMIYWCVAICIAAIVVLFAPLIAGYWIKPERMSVQTVQHAIQVMGIVIACRWPVGLYQGALNGLQLNTVTSAVAVVMTTLGSGGAVLLLAYAVSTVEAFFIWQACVGLLYAVTLRRLAWRAIQSEDSPRFDTGELRRIWKFATSVALISLLGIFFTQVDKVILSKIISLGDFGCYMLATVIAGGLYLLVVPLFNALYPRFSFLVASGNEAELRRLYRVGTRLLATLLFPVAFMISAFARDLVFVWTGDELLAGSVAPLLSLLSLGSALHCVMYFPYALQLAYGVPRLTLQINLLLLSVLVPVTVILASRYGAIGGAAAWLILHVANILLGTWLTHRRLLTDIGVQWLIHDVFRPLVLSAFIVVAAHYLVGWLKLTAVLGLLLAAGSATAAIVVGLVTSPQLGKLVVNHLRVRRLTV
jgi:O-antigen/teichoic acid export membrane protein